MGARTSGALCACGIALACAAAASGGEPFVALEAGGATLELSREGSLALKRDGRVLISGSELVVAGAAWAGSGSQRNARPDRGYPRRTPGGAEFRLTITEPVSGVEWRLVQTVRREQEGFRLRYEVSPAADAQCAETALFMDLPLSEWRGKRVAVPPQGELTFPEERPSARHFFGGSIRRAVLGAGERQTTLAFSAPTSCTFQDAREFGSQVYQIYPSVFSGGRLAAGAKRSLEFTIIPEDGGDYTVKEEAYPSGGALAIRDVRLPRGSAREYERYEIDLDITGTWETPFDPDQVRVDGHFRLPSGREVTVPAFFHREHELMEADGRKWVEPREGKGWRIRFAPTEPGRHSFHVTARDRSGEVRSRAFRFRAAQSGGDGYVRVSRRDPRYFEFDDGAPYFAVGENAATTNSGPWDYDTWFGRLGHVGGNYARIWMWSYHQGIEWGKPGNYRMQSAWEMDYALAAAERNGIYVKLCLEAWRGFDGDFCRASDVHPYWSKNGGPCDAEHEVFTHPEARRMFRNRLRYCAARWGYSTHILAWEFWNEIDCVRGYHNHKADVVRWTAEMAHYLRETDPWDHMIVNSLGSFVENADLWRLPEMDFAQIHGYWHPTLAASREAGKDMAAMVPEWIGRVSVFGKPALYAEFGLVNDTWGHSPRADEDSRGVHLHNGLWSSIMTGSCGTAMLWWWGNYVDPHDLYFHFGAVARFVGGVPWTTAGFKAVAPEATSPDVRGMALVGIDRGKGVALAWLQNRRHTWWNVVEKNPVGRVERATITIPGLPDGRYRVQWWDTWEGLATRTEGLVARGGGLEVEVRDLERDVALKVRGE